MPVAWEQFQSLDSQAEEAELQFEQEELAVAELVNQATSSADSLREKVRTQTNTLDKFKKQHSRAKIELKRASAEAFAITSKPKEIEDALIKMEEPFSVQVPSLCARQAVLTVCILQAELFVRAFSGHTLPASQLIAGGGSLWSAGLDRTLKRSALKPATLTPTLSYYFDTSLFVLH